ncbi:MAG: tetratricopeptide repeat protein [Caulobacter sp.]|nr:tetratricopeptide repeat protein [Caulobacter sp.]
MLAGILFAGLGWAILGPGAIAGVEPPSIQLGMFEGHRSFIGWGAAALGIVALLSSVLPRGGGGGGGKRRAAPRIDFDAEPAPSAADGEPVGGGPTAFAPQAPPPTASPPPRLETVADETFADLRERLRTLVREEQWPTAAALARRLPTSATNDEERLLAARDLGDFARAQGAGEEAAEAYEMALASARGLAAEAPTDPVRLAMLAGVLTGVGDSAQDEGRLEAAVEAYEEALEIRRQLAREDTSTEARRALSLALERLGDAREDRGHRVRAHDLYRESLEIAGQLAAADPQKYGEDLQVTRRRLGELEARLAAV